ncbi:MAG: GNAT family N-acetyltransferase [Solirubrobacteraceae bacterium]
MTEIREIVPPDTGIAFEAMRELRTHLTGEEDFAARVDELQRPEGYRLAGVFDEGEQRPGSVAGFRILTTLAWGRTLYVDDLSTLPSHRRRGHARALLDWLAEEARSHGCDQLHLDSGLGENREDAHRLYFNAGLRIVSHHFARELE